MVFTYTFISIFIYIKLGDRRLRLNIKIMKTIKVNYAQDPSIFKVPNVNRNINTPESQNRIRRIAESMEVNGILLDPIIVTTQMSVVDGRHRVEAAKLAGKGLFYIIDESIANTPRSIFDAERKYNIDTKSWTKKDYIRGHALYGLESYKIVEHFQKKFPMFSLTEVLMFLNNSGTKHANKRTFADGKYEVNPDNAERGVEWASKIIELKDVFPEGYKRSIFIRALLTILEVQPKFDLDYFTKQCKKYPKMLKLQPDKPSYARMVEEIYNMDKKVKIKLPTGTRKELV